TTPGGTATSTGGYTYNPLPAITTIDPNKGPVAGGNTITITGSNLTAATVQIDGNSCAPATVNLAGTSLTCPVPAGTAPGAVDVTVTTTAGGTTTSTGGYTYVGLPSAAVIAPSSGPTAGGQTVTITGTNFEFATDVTIGGTACTNLMWNANAQELTCTTPPGTAGSTTVLITTPGGTTTTNYTYVPAPTVSAIDPDIGPLTGGQSVTITGTNLTGATVTIGGNVCTNPLVGEGGTTVTCAVPAGDEVGPTDVLITTPAGGSVETTGGYTYYAAPVVVGIEPDQGPLTGGNTITLTGEYLEFATEVQVDGQDCVSFTWNSNNATLDCVVPPGTAGLVDVTVTTPAGTDTVVDGYTYVPVPAATAIDPATGPLAGGNTVTITGTNLNGAAVTIGGSTCTNVTINESGTSLTCTVAAGPQAGVTDVVVTTSGGVVTLTGAYTYVGQGASAPPNKPRDLTVTGKPTAKKFLINWRVPTQTANGRPVAAYRLTIIQRGPNKLIFRKGLKASTTKYTVTRKFLLKQTFRARGDFPAKLKYKVRIEALNSKGGGPLAVSYLTLKL
ncbi:MAG: IPT/TIG domain-containing protein, partial [Candidatus Nanopelagicales bacterium]